MKGLAIKLFSIKLYRNILVAIGLLFIATLYNYLNGDTYTTQADWHEINLTNEYGALDVKTPRVLSYKLTTINPSGEEQTVAFDAEIANNRIKIPLNPFIELDVANVIGEFSIDARGLVTHPTDEDSLIPSVVMLFDSMPDTLIKIGTTWERRRPTDAEAIVKQSVVIQSRREYKVTTAWDTPDGIIVRVYVRGFARWVSNNYLEMIADIVTLPTDERPEHYGYVDINLNTGTVIDALFYSEFLSDAKTPEEILHQKAVKILRLCPGTNASFNANKDTCL